MRRNIELKARCADLARAAAACERLGARRVWTRRQVDTYFAVTKGRLKLRVEEPGDAALVRYQRDDVAGARESLYEVSPVADASGALAALAAKHGIRCRVEKTRTLYLLENVRIHLDDVAGLGTFVEFEAVMGGGSSDAASNALLRRLRSELGIGDAELVAASYSDLLAGGAEE
ncbi:MAG TPA: class IV adenylate cyclase [Planctomycetota bacterium]|nr:class IV adenylate cyclase [Planctomycetota bacterium]